MSSREPLRRSPRKRPPRGDEHSSNRKRNNLRTHRKRKPDRKQTGSIKKVEKTFLDEKLDLYSEKNNPDIRQKTDIMSDDFDPVAFLYSDVEPPHTENDSDGIRAADCVQMLLAKWDREDGIVTDINAGKKERGWKKIERRKEILGRDVSGLRAIQKAAEEARLRDKSKKYQIQPERGMLDNSSDDCDLDKLATSLYGPLSSKRREELYGDRPTFSPIKSRKGSRREYQ